MGLLLSILVTCVGVVELLTFYHNVRNRVNYQPIESSLTTLRDQYLKELEDVRDRLVAQLEELKQKENAVSLPSKIPTLRLNSHEDIQVEFNEKAVARSRSPSPRRFLLSETKNSTPTTTRHFIASEEPQCVQGIKKSRAQECLPEYLIEEEKQSSVPRYILTDDSGPVPLPLPEKFVVTEHERGGEAKTDVFRKKLGHTIVEVDGELYYRRSPSPFPSFDLTCPRNSVCSVLLDESASVAEVDEFSRSNSASPVNAEATSELSNFADINNNSEKVNDMLNEAHSSSQYWDNKNLVIPEKKSKSRSPSPAVFKKGKTAERRRSLSESANVDISLNMRPIQKTASSLEFSKESNDRLSSSDEEFIEVNAYTEEMKNSLDGVDRKKGCIKKKYVKRKRVKNRVADNNTNQLGSANEVESLENKSAKTALPQDQNIKKNSSGPKPGEPFWVNR